MEDEAYFDTIITGLHEAVEVSKGNLKNIKRRKVTVSPYPKYDAHKIKSIRESLNLSQVIFAKTIGVSVKTIEAWESGRYTPQGPASRLLQLLEQDKHFLEEHKILCL
ncbi:MAG: helix-turn-helix domain-containing protein [Spirochaetales bacterium]|nr:helix-turn-helix domain-containing protein [Spirochaetales bacterium]